MFKEQILPLHLVHCNISDIVDVDFSIFSRVNRSKPYLKIFFAERNSRELLVQYGFSSCSHIVFCQYTFFLHIYSAVNFLRDTFNCVLIELKETRNAFLFHERGVFFLSEILSLFPHVWYYFEVLLYLNTNIYRFSLN